MPIFRNSRYLQQDKVTAIDAAGRVRSVYELRDTTVPRSEQSVHTREVTPEPGAEMQLVARELFGDQRLWWVIADHNPDVFYPLDYSDGTLLRVPPRSSILSFTRFRKKG